MPTRAEARLRAVAFVIAGGVFAGLVLFLLTGTYTSTVLGGPGVHLVSSAGFDPWTGVPHGATIEYRHTISAGQYVIDRPPVTDPVPEELRDRRVIPFPVGFAVGAAVTLAIVMVTSTARTRRAQATP